MGNLEIYNGDAEVVELGSGKRIFTHDKIRKVVDAALASVPPSKRYAFVAIGFKAANGALTTRMAFMVKLSESGKWSFGGFAEGPVKNPFQSYGAELRFSG